MVTPDDASAAPFLTAASPPAPKARHVPPKPLEREKKRKRLLRTWDAADSRNVNRNVVLPLHHLLSFTENNFCCKRCHKTLNNCPGKQTASPLGLEIFGVAAGLNFQCDCGAKQSLRPRVVPEAAPKLKTPMDGQPLAARVDLNRRLLLRPQACGEGQQEGNVVAGTLLPDNPMKAKWTKVAEKINEVIIGVGEEVLEENLHIECSLSPKGDDGRSALDVASDTR
jgi:hypothetical protein